MSSFVTVGGGHGALRIVTRGTGVLTRIARASGRAAVVAAVVAAVAVLTEAGTPAWAQPKAAPAPAPAASDAASPAKPAAPGQKVLRYAFNAGETGFDPARIVDLYSRIVTTHIFEALYTYD
ncbi:MAG: hypothetical protein ACKOD9_11715, partial [Rubrivivax sp.]